MDCNPIVLRLRRLYYRHGREEGIRRNGWWCQRRSRCSEEQDTDEEGKERLIHEVQMTSLRCGDVQNTLLYNGSSKVATVRCSFLFNISHKLSSCNQKWATDHPCLWITPTESTCLCKNSNLSTSNRPLLPGRHYDLLCAELHTYCVPR